MESYRIRSVLIAVTAGLVLLVSALPSPAGVIDAELQDVLDEMRSGDQVSVILRFARKVDLGRYRDQDIALRRRRMVTALREQAERSHEAVAHILARPGVTRQTTLWVINGKAITTGAEIIRDLAVHPAVESIRLDAVIEAPATESTGSAVPEWNLGMIRAPEMWDLGQTGAGVVVAGLDTGVDAGHQDLAPRFRGGSNSWFDPNGEHATPYDKTGHGTQALGLIVGGSAGGTAIGVAPDAVWIAVKIFNDAGTAPLSAIHQGFQWVLDPDGNPNTDDAADVVNNSWSLGNAGDCDQEFEADIATLKSAGIATVFSGGNYGPSYGTSVSPANNPSGFAVGAVDRLDLISGSSASGPAACDGTVYPEVVAPGIGVRTADLTFGSFPDSYTSVSGTSFSAPHVAGAMALLRGAHSGATVAELERALTETAVDGGNAGADNVYGHGRIDIVAAEAWLAEPPGPVCTDADGDGFFAETDCGTPSDCDDSDSGVNPAACDIKNDGIDQDCDGVDRTRGKGCPGSGGDTGGSEGKGKTCSDGIDNDGDGWIDCSDPDCSRSRSCR